MNMNDKNIAEKTNITFLKLRKKIGTQEKVAKLLSVSQTIIAKYEKGKAYPRRNTLRKLSDLFGVSEGEILKAIDNSK